MTGSVTVRPARTVDAGSLLELLGAHDLEARLGGDASEIEVGFADEDEERVLAEVSDALDEWLADCGLPFVPQQVGRRSYVIRPPAE